MPHLLRCVLLLIVCVPVAAQTGATYQVRVDATWSASTHPAMFPQDAHFSPPVGAAHDASAVFWVPGGLASAAMEEMAEEGLTAGLRREVRDAGAATSGVLSAPAFESPGGVELTATLTDTHPLLTLVTMVAPSPDWFIGVHGLDVREAGEWPASLTVDLHAYDAGTDSGTTYEGPDVDTQPRDLIRQLTVPPFENGLPLGTLTLTRLTVDSAGDPSAGRLTLRGPSPARAGDALRVSVPAGAALRVTLLDATGRLVALLHDGVGGDVSIHLPAVAPGLYLVVAYAGGDRLTRLLPVAR